MIEEFSMVLAHVAAAETLLAKKTPLALPQFTQEPSPAKRMPAQTRGRRAGYTLAEAGEVLHTRHLKQTALN